MDSLPGEDPTLPLELNGSVTVPRLPDLPGDEVHVRLAGGGALPDVAEDTLSPTRVRTMKDFENQIIELRKENFNLKLRIYFLEERIQQKFEGPAEDIYRINMELKIELESLKQDLQERDRLLIKASKAMESLSQGGDAEIQRIKEEARKRVQEVEESLAGRISLLEENLKVAQTEVEKAFAMTEQERVRRLAAEEQLSAITKMPPKDLALITVLEEKDRCIEQLSLSLKNQEAVIRRLEEAKSQSVPEEEPQKDALALVREREQELEALRMEFSNEKSDLEKRIQSLQQQLQDQETELSAEKRNALKRDKTIQGLTLALKVKENENEELTSEIEDLTVSLNKAREATHKAQVQNYKGAEDRQTLLMEKEALLADLRSENLTKETENRKLQKKIKRTEQELSDLQLEKEKLLKELEEAQLEKSRSDKTINDLRNQLEKLHNEMSEKEKVMELEYGAALHENSEKLQSQELVIRRLTDSVTQKDALLQKLDGVVKVKDAELLALSAKLQNLLKDKAAVQRQQEGLSEETSAQPPLNQMIQTLEKMKAAESTGMFEVLWKEQDTLSNLIKSLKNGIGISDLQEELNNIFLLRKQLEDEILANWNLRKVLEEQIKANRKEDETVSSWGDHTSYMSICLREQDSLNVEIDHLSLEELKKKVVELISMVKELHLANTDLKRQQLRLSSSPLAEERSGVLDGSEDIPPSDSLDRDGRNLNKPGYACELAPDKGFLSGSVDKNCHVQPRSSPGSLLNETGAARLGSSRQEEMKIADKLLDHLNTSLPDASSHDLENKNEEDLKQLIIQLRTDLKQLRQVNTFEKQCIESNSAWSEKGGPDPGPLPNAEPEVSRVGAQDAVAQTMSGEGSAVRLKCEGRIGAPDALGTSLRFGEEYQRQRTCAKIEQQETLPQAGRTRKSDPCHVSRKSRLPILLKSSRSLSSISLRAPCQKPDMILQHRIFTLDEVLKDVPGQPLLMADELQSSEADNERSAQDGVLQGARSLMTLESPEADISLETGDGKGREESLSEVVATNTPKSSLPTPEKLDPELSPPDQHEADVTTLSTISKSLLSLKPSCTSADAIDVDSMDDIEGLRHHIRTLEAKLAKYRMILKHFETTKRLPPGDGVSVIQNEGDLPENQDFPPTVEACKPESKAFSGVSQPLEYEIHADVLGPPNLEQCNEETVEKLKALLLENEAELEKEQIANLHLLDEVYRLQSKLKGASPVRHDGTALSPSHGDSCQHLKIQETFSICVAYRQHLANLIRTFEELLQASEVDYCVAEGFREQLNQSAQLFERLERQCLYGESINDAATQLGGLTESLTNYKTTQMSSNIDLPGTEKEGREQEEEEEEDEEEEEEGKLPIAEAQVPPRLLMEHLQEIRMLRHQLEESIQTNNRLRKRLEQQALGPVQDQDSANVCICSSEQHNSLTSEIHFLRKQNQALNGMLAKGSQEKQKENEKLRDSLSKKSFALEHLQMDFDRLKKENEKLQKKLKKREEENKHLTHDSYNVRNELNRLQIELNARQHQLSENDKLLHSLRLELKVYEKLNEAIRSQKDCSRERLEECRKDENHPFDLHELLMEIRNLRTQLEISIQANQILHEKVEEQLLRAKREDGTSGSTVNISYLFKQDSQTCPGMNELKFSAADSNILELEQKYGNSLAPVKAASGPQLMVENLESSSWGSSSAGKTYDPAVVPRHCIWADKNGRHVLGFVEDYNSLRKLISEGRKLLAEEELLLKDPGFQEQDQLGALSRLSPVVCVVQKNLEEAARLLKLLWRVSLPMKVVHGAAYSLQDENMRAELRKLRWKVTEQEKKLHSTVKRLHSTAQMKENMERVIIDQLALTHDVLKKARGNLEILPAEHKTLATSLSKKNLF